MLADPRSLEALDFARVRERLAGQTHAAQAHARALAMEPVSDATTVRRLVTETAEMRTLVRVQNFALSQIDDVDEALEIAQRGASLPAAELRAIADALSAGGAAVRAIREAESVPALGLSRAAHDRHAHHGCDRRTRQRARPRIARAGTRAPPDRPGAG